MTSRRVLQFSTMVPPMYYGGAERVVDWLSDELQARDLIVRNAGLSARGDESTTAIKNIYWPFDGKQRGVIPRSTWHAIDAFTLAARRAVTSIVKEFRPDVIVTHNLRGWGFAPWTVAASRAVPLVHVMHDYGLICNSATLWRHGDCQQLCAPCRPRRGATMRRWPGGSVVAVSAAVAAEHVRYQASLASSAVIAHPLPAAAALARSSRTDRHDGAPAVIGYLGRIDESKGVDLLLAATRKTGQRVLIAGTGEPSYLQQLQQPPRDDVDWLGFTDPAELFDRIDVLVVPSLWREPFGLVVVEAARTGVPVLIADRGGLIEAARASHARFATFASGEESSLRTALARPLALYRKDPAPETVDLVRLIADTASGRRAAE